MRPIAEDANHVWLSVLVDKGILDLAIDAPTNWHAAVLCILSEEREEHVATVAKLLTTIDGHVSDFTVLIISLRITEAKTTQWISAIVCSQVVEDRARPR